MTPSVVQLPSFAKINLGLAVGARRNDGFHELLTLYQTIGLADDLTIARSRRRGVRIQCDDPALPRDAGNLVARAYRALEGEVGRLVGVEVRIVKRIPVGGGLGGGSSNAAMALLGMDRIFGLGLGIERLAALASTLGSDVPFFLVGGLALGLGRGERVVPVVDLRRRRWVVLANPGRPVSTAEVYRRLAASRPRAGRGAPKAGWLTLPDAAGSIFRFFLEQARGSEDLSFLGNDLAAPARDLVFGYDRLVTQLESCGAELALLSGSGATVFGLFGSQRQARAAARKLVVGRVDVVKMVSRGEYSSWLREGLGGREASVLRGGLALPREGAAPPKA